MKIIKSLGFIFVLSILVISCGKDNNNGSDSKLTPQAVDKIAGTSWCFVDNMADDFQVVSRMTFKGKGEFADGSKATLDYLRLTPDQVPQVHLAERSHEWLMKKVDDDFLWSDRYTVNLIEDQYKVSSQDNFRQQELIFDQILRNNPNLKINSEKFEPRMAITVENSNLLSEDSKTVGYPCSDFSPSFLAQNPSRPMVEFNLFLHQKIWAARHDYDPDNEYRFEKAMLLSFPLEVKPVSQDDLLGSAWCSWYQLGDFSTHVKLVTFSENKFVEQTYLDALFEHNASEEALVARLKEKAQDASVYDISLMEKGLIKGSFKSELGGSEFTIERLFFSITDGNGVEVLAKGNLYHPDNSSFLFSDLYFRCSDSRPLELHEGFKKRLPTIIDLQYEAHTSN